MSVLVLVLKDCPHPAGQHCLTLRTCGKYFRRELLDVKSWLGMNVSHLRVTFSNQLDICLKDSSAIAYQNELRVGP